MIRFEDDDDGYLTWLVRHPEGYVLNTPRKATASYLRLHRASCRLPSGVPANGLHWTNHYVKICGSEAELRRWADVELSTEPWSCARCL